jgi:ABC-2 type transport system ATP-binding protein
MANRATSMIRNLSKGMRQRVGLAQALIHDPKVLILDEPTIGLDPHQVQDLRDLIHELGQTHTVMLSTHILSEAEQVCDRVVIIDQGKIVAEDTPSHLRDRLYLGGRLFVRIGRHSSGQDVPKMLAAVSGVASVETYGEGYIVSAKRRADVRPALSAAVVRHDMDLLELRPLAVTLEEIFIELTTRLGDESTRRGG